MAEEKKNKSKSENSGDAKDKDKDKKPPEHHDDAVVETHHSTTVRGETLSYTATAGRIVLKEDDDTKKASFFFTAYTLDGVDDPAARPIVFAFNGGPGSSSVWLHLGVLGPKLVEFDEKGNGVSTPGRLIDNDHTLLTHADLVFIDPVSTGFTRAIDKDEEKAYHHFEKDIEAVGDFVRRYLTTYERWASPKFLAGESYGTTRSAGLAGYLQSRYGLYLNGVILISSVLNFQTIALDSKTYTFHRGNDLPYVLYLPTYAATAWYHKTLDLDLQQRDLPDLLREVEAFAENEYLLALEQGSRLDHERFDEIADTLARYTSLSTDFIKRSDLRIEKFHFMKELLRDKGLTVGRLDSRYQGVDRFDVGSMLEHDPSLDVWMGPFSAMLNNYMRRDLGYESDLVYEILNPKVWPWNYENFQNTYVDVSETLRDTMTKNPFLRVYIASGFFDLATPYFATEHTIAHLGLEPGLRDNIEVSHFDAGHMMYVHGPSIERLGEDLRNFVERAT
ncbi:MAG: peptidase S10 [Actinomycetia bacterium]|nr:peptidase S10 [Actinomycetes bacterium]